MQLAAVLDAGGVSEGAAMLGPTQPAVSRSLAMLEARVGAPLFLKGRRPLQATPLAAQLAAQGRIIIAASRQASNAAQGFVKGTHGSVRIGGVPFFMDAIISRMIGEFQMQEPQITVQQSYMNLPEVWPRWRAGRSTSASSRSGRPPPAPASNSPRFCPAATSSPAAPAIR